MSEQVGESGLIEDFGPDDLKRLAILGAVEQVYGMCTGCGSVEVALVKVTGTRDLSNIGESAEYPTGYGCEVCS